MNPLMAYLARLVGHGQPAAPAPATQPQPALPQGTQYSQADYNSMYAEDPPAVAGYPFAPNDPAKFGSPGEQSDMNYDLINRFLRSLQQPVVSHDGDDDMDMESDDDSDGD